jgi:hypothetical protein
VEQVKGVRKHWSITQEGISERFAYIQSLSTVQFFWRGNIDVEKGMYVAEKCSENGTALTSSKETDFTTPTQLRRKCKIMHLTSS